LQCSSSLSTTDSSESVINTPIADNSDINSTFASDPISPTYNIDESMSTISLMSSSPASIAADRHVSSTSTIDTIGQQYDRYRNDYSGSLVESRCVLFGHNHDDDYKDYFQSSRELLVYDSLEEADNFEADIREFQRNIYIVLEKRRLDLSFERLDTPPCPLLAEEEKYRIGVDNRLGKVYR